MQLFNNKADYMKEVWIPMYREIQIVSGLLILHFGVGGQPLDGLQESV